MKLLRRLSFFKSKIYLKMFLAFYAAFLFPLAVAGIIAYNISFQSASGKIEEEYAQKLDKACGTIDENFSVLLSSSVQVSQMPWVKRILSMPENTFGSSITVNDVRDYMNEVTLLCLSNRFVRNIAICFPRQDLIISDRYKENIGDFFTYLIKLEGMGADDWQAY
jgi:hypothetical protein